MAEKLYKCHCTVPGHGTWCEVAQDKRKSKRELSKLRRRLEKEEIQKELRHLTPAVRGRGKIARAGKLIR